MLFDPRRANGCRVVVAQRKESNYIWSKTLRYLWRCSHHSGGSSKKKRHKEGLQERWREFRTKVSWMQTKLDGKLRNDANETLRAIHPEKKGKRKANKRKWNKIKCRDAISKTVLSSSFCFALLSLSVSVSLFLWAPSLVYLDGLVCHSRCESPISSSLFLLLLDFWYQGW